MYISKYFENTNELFDGLEDMSLDSIKAFMENAADIVIREQFEIDMEKHLERTPYPCFGYTTAQKFENEEEYKQFIQEDFEKQLQEWLDSAGEYAEFEMETISKELETAIANSLRKSSGHQNDSASIYFNYDGEHWCLSGETIGKLLWETDDFEATNQKEAEQAAIEHLEWIDES